MMVKEANPPTAILRKIVDTPATLSPAVDVAVQSAALLVPESQRGSFVDDLNALVQAIMQGRDSDAADIVERYHLGANFGAILLRYRDRARGRN